VVVQRSVEVGPDLAELAVEVVGVEEVAVAVVGELTGDVDGVTDFDALSEPELICPEAS